MQTATRARVSLIVLTSLLLANCERESTTKAPAEVAVPDDGSVLPFPPPASSSVAKPRLQDSTMK